MNRKLCVVLCLLFAAAGLFAKGGADSGVKPGQKVIHIVGSVRRYPGEEAAWASVIKKFEAENPDIKVVVRWQGQWNEIPQNLAAAKMSGEAVDLFTAGAGVLNQTLASSGSVMDLTEIMKPYLSRFNEGMLSAYYIGGHLWGFPYGDADLSLVYYNADMFAELGLEPPRTYQELLNIAGILKSRKNIIPMVHQGKIGGFWPMWFFETYAQTSGNASVAKVNDFLAQKGTISGPAGSEAFRQIKRFFDDGILTKESLDLDGDGVRAAFSQGKTAMFYGGTWEFAPAMKAVDGKFKIGAFPFPSLGLAGRPQHGGGPSDAIVIPSFAPKENIPTTMKFVEFILRPEIANEILSTYSPIVSVIKGVVPVQSSISEVLNSRIAPDTIAFLDWIWPLEVNNAFVQAIPAVVAGQMTPDEAAALVDDALKTLIREKDYRADWYNTWSQNQWRQVTP
jgi:raffinose/stachyose/melibiose transport system substrate-binding protein